MDIYLGKSLAGHDKKHIYVVYKEEDNSLTLVNGTTKPLDKPKVKNKKHIQLIKHLPKEVENITSKINDINELDDNLIREIIDCYNNYLSSKQ